MPRSLILIISGPAGAGKTTLCDALLAAYPGQVERIVTTTTRAPRAGEVDGRDYHFLDRATFMQRVEAGEFLEWAPVHGNCYGVQTRHLRERLHADMDLLLNIDVQGAASFRAAAKAQPDLAARLVSVFVTPRDVEELRLRLSLRGSETPENLERRIQNAEAEMARAQEFDHVILSDTREADFAALQAFYHLAKAR